MSVAPEPNASSEPSAVKRAFGALLMAVGGLIATLSGLCSVLFLVSMVFAVMDSHSANDAMVPLLIVFVVGGVPFALGAGLFVLGRHLRRRPESS